MGVNLQKKIVPGGFQTQIKEGWIIRYLPILFFIILIFMGSKEPILFAVGVILFVLFYYKLLNPLIPPVLLFCFVFQWFFNQGQLVQAVLKGVPVGALLARPRTAEHVILLGLIGTSSFFLGIIVNTRKLPILTFDSIRQFFLRINLGRLLRLYLFVYLFLFIAGNYIWLYPGLTQPLYMLSYFRWSIFFLLFCSVLFQKRFLYWLLLIIAVEFVLGFLSFFANFKEVLYFSIIAYWIFYFRSKLYVKWLITLGVIVIIFIGSLWSYVKQDYRNFLNQGSGSQVVVVGKAEAFNKFLLLSSSVSSKQISEGFDQLILRLSWIGAFNQVYNHVPAKVPHQEGGLWLDGISRPFTPRLIFPDKKIMTDSKELNYYSGYNIDEKNTSISLSMIAGSYVDFGDWGMHVVLFVFGLFCGWVFRKVIFWGNHPMIGYALTMPTIYLLSINEQSINRIVSAMVLYFVAVWFVKTFLLRYFTRFILT